MNPDMAAGAALVAAGVAGLVAWFAATLLALRRTGHTTGQVEPLRSVSAPLPATARPLDDDLSVGGRHRRPGPGRTRRWGVGRGRGRCAMSTVGRERGRYALSTGILRRAASVMRTAWGDAAISAAELRSQGQLVGTTAPTMVALAGWLDDIAARHAADPDPIDLTLHYEEECPTGECEDPGYHVGCIVCAGCYPQWEGMDGYSLWPCREFKAALAVALAYLDEDGAR